MGFKVGCPVIKLARKVGKNAGKHTGNLQGVLCEGWECGVDKDGQSYRFCHDDDYNRSLTAGNRYEGIRNAFELGREIANTADSYSAVRQMNGGRKIRDTAGIGWCAILKPPAAIINGLSEAQQAKFATDLLESFRAATADIIRQDTINAVWQVDEAGGHWHLAGAAITPDGELNADKIVNPKLFTALNKTLPAEMRQRGWECDECVNYDPDKAKDMSEAEKQEYKAKCKGKRPKSGLSSDKFKAKKDKERLDYLEGLAEYAKTVKFKDGSTVLSRYEAQREKAVNSPQKPVEAAQTPKVVKRPVEPQKPLKTPQKSVEAPKLDEAAQARVKATLAAMQRQQQAEQDGRALTANIEGVQNGPGKSL